MSNDDAHTDGAVLYTHGWKCARSREHDAGDGCSEKAGRSDCHAMLRSRLRRVRDPQRTSSAMRTAKGAALCLAVAVAVGCAS
jgi:hypothetical protein